MFSFIQSAVEFLEKGLEAPPESTDMSDDRDEGPVATSSEDDDDEEEDEEDEDEEGAAPRREKQSSASAAQMRKSSGRDGKAVRHDLYLTQQEVEARLKLLWRMQGEVSCGYKGIYIC